MWPDRVGNGYAMGSGELMDEGQDELSASRRALSGIEYCRSIRQ